MVDSGKTAAPWIDQNLPRGAHIALESYGPFIDQYDDLFGSLEMVKTFTDGGYEIRIYRLTKP